MTDLHERLGRALSDRYRIDSEIGRGGMAVVFLAYDRKHERRVAIKVLRPELAASLASDRFLREIRIAAQLQHPHILALYDSGETDGLLYYVMPYVDGETLRQRLDREKQLGMEDVLRVTEHVAQALAHAHSCGVVHRDVKPENILLMGDHALVADFGVARALSSAGVEFTDSGVAVGTPAYMSPEQAAGEPDVDARSDIYALACVVFEMLGGEPPFTGVTPRSVLARHVNERPPSVRVIRPTVSQGIEEALSRALAKVPADRPSTALAFMEAISLRTATAADTPRRPRRPIVQIAAAGAVLLALAAVALGPWDRSTDAVVRAPTRVAVLYFNDLSTDGSLSHIAAGLTEDLIDQLSHVDPLQVVSATRVREYRDRGLSLDSLSHELRAGMIVEGAVDGHRDQFEVTVRLIDAVTGDVLVSITAERPEGEILAVRDEIVTRVTRGLREGLGEELLMRQTRAEATSAQAWELVQRAQELHEYAKALARQGDAAGTLRAVLQADSVLVRAERLDPQWVVPPVRRGWMTWSATAATRALRDPPPGSREPADWVRLGLSHAARAIERAPDDPRVYELRGTLRFRLWELEGRSARDSLLVEAEHDLRAAVRDDPQLAAAWYGLSSLLLARGDVTEAEQAARMALRKDAYLASAEPTVTSLFYATLDRGDFAGARRWCAEGRERFPPNPNFVECRLTVLGWSADTRTALDSAWREVERMDGEERFEIGWPYRRMMIAAILARIGMADSAVAVMQAARLRFPDEPMLNQEAYVRLLLGQRERALDLLDAFLDAHPQRRPYIRNHYWFRPLADNRRFLSLTAGEVP